MLIPPSLAVTVPLPGCAPLPLELLRADPEPESPPPPEDAFPSAGTASAAPQVLKSASRYALARRVTF
jgi:hypothetical protein